MRSRAACSSATRAGSPRIAPGDTERGLADLFAVGERLEVLGVHNPSHVAWRSQAALVLLAQGERGQARRLAREEVEIARRWGARRPLGAALRTAGLVEGDKDSLALFRESVEVLAHSPAPERAKSLTELGATLRRVNQRAEARELLTEGLELATLCGATPLAERAHAELLAAGARPRRLVRTGVDSLTPSERRVAQMAADGRTNREIAQSLFVTPRTVEMHLTPSYRKLDIQSRSQLASAMTTSRDTTAVEKRRPLRLHGTDVRRRNQLPRSKGGSPLTSRATSSSPHRSSRSERHRWRARDSRNGRAAALIRASA